MLHISMYITIQTLWEQGHNKAEIAKHTGHNWKTVNKIINTYRKGKLDPNKKPHPCILDKHQALVLELLEKDLSGVRIHEDTVMKVNYFFNLGINKKLSTLRSY